MKKFLVVNDDGIMADGIIRLARAARELGEVWVVAPAGERSAASHSISLRTPLDIYPVDFPVEGVHAFSCSGTPADCVRVAVHAIMDEKPDLLLSGVNNGYNTGTDAQYSATIGAAMEGAFQGIRSIAVSKAYDGLYEVTDALLPELLKEYRDYALGYMQIVNINIPGCPISEYKGILRDRALSHSMFFTDTYGKTEDLPGGGIRYSVIGTYQEKAEEGSDIHALLNNYISVGVVTNLL